jgi:hypothetical protein
LDEGVEALVTFWVCSFTTHVSTESYVLSSKIFDQSSTTSYG